MVDADGDGEPGGSDVTGALILGITVVNPILCQVEDQSRSVGDKKHHH